MKTHGKMHSVFLMRWRKYHFQGFLQSSQLNWTSTVISQTFCQWQATDEHLESRHTEEDEETSSFHSLNCYSERCFSSRLVKSFSFFIIVCAVLLFMIFSAAMGRNERNPFCTISISIRNKNQRLWCSSWNLLIQTTTTLHQKLMWSFDHRWLFSDRTKVKSNFKTTVPQEIAPHLNSVSF